MLVHKLGHYTARFHHNGEIPPYTGPEPIASRLERMHVRGTHAITYTNLAPHSHTYARDTCKFSSIPTSSSSSSTHSLHDALPIFIYPPRHSSDRGSPA